MIKKKKINNTNIQVDQKWYRHKPERMIETKRVKIFIFMGFYM